jgi:hypothetical protein
MAAARKWREAYARLADELHAEGNLRDARQKRRLVRDLDDLLTVMELQRAAETDGGYSPFFKGLPGLHETTGSRHG